MAFPQQNLQIDLSTQRILISPDDPLPVFNPRPKAIMVIPIYHDSEIAQYPKLTGQPNAPDSRAVLSKTATHHGQQAPPHKHKRRLGLFRRASSYSPPPKERSQSRSRHRRDHSVPPPQGVTTYDGYLYPATTAVPGVPHSRGRSHSRHRSSKSAAPPISPYHYTHALGSPYGMTLDKGDRARPPNDPLVTHPPSYQVQATHPSSSPYGHSPLSPTTPHYSSTPNTNYGYGRGERERPPSDPLADNTAGYQVQATQPQGGIVGGYGGLAGGEHALESANAMPTTGGSHYGGGGHYGGRPSSQYNSGGHYGSGGGHGGGGGGGHTKIEQAAAAIPLAHALSHGTQAQQGQALDAFLRDYFKVLPPNPKWCASRCRGTRKAVCIGINYVGQRDELKGCANDARHMRDFLIQTYAFPASNILLLTDDDRTNAKPTRKEMFQAMAWLVQGARKDDSLFFHYSGHGGQSQDASGREVDDMDETIFPVDYKEAGDIIDDELYQALVKPLPAGCRLTAIFDSCHSGTVLDLPYIHSAHGRLRSMRHVSRRAKTRGVAPSADVICFSACRDDETSADTFKGGVAVGAMSHALVRSLKNNKNQTYEELLTHLREILIPEYDQKAQVSATHPLDLKERFNL